MLTQGVDEKLTAIGSEEVIGSLGTTLRGNSLLHAACELEHAG
jgi:hypothetical protein